MGAGTSRSSAPQGVGAGTVQGATQPAVVRLSSSDPPLQETARTASFSTRVLVLVVSTETQAPVTENTVYAIASVSKHFTTTLLGQKLSEAGQYSQCGSVLTVWISTHSVGQHSQCRSVLTVPVSTHSVGQYSQCGSALTV